MAIPLGSIFPTSAIVAHTSLCQPHLAPASGLYACFLFAICSRIVLSLLILTHVSYKLYFYPYGYSPKVLVLCLKTAPYSEYRESKNSVPQKLKNKKIFFPKMKPRIKRMYNAYYERYCWYLTAKLKNEMRYSYQFSTFEGAMDHLGLLYKTKQIEKVKV